MCGPRKATIPRLSVLDRHLALDWWTNGSTICHGLFSHHFSGHALRGHRKLSWLARQDQLCKRTRRYWWGLLIQPYTTRRQRTGGRPDYSSYWWASFGGGADFEHRWGCG